MKWLVVKDLRIIGVRYLWDRELVIIGGNKGDRDIVDGVAEILLDGAKGDVMNSKSGKGGKVKVVGTVPGRVLSHRVEQLSLCGKGYSVERVHFLGRVMR